MTDLKASFMVLCCLAPVGLAESVLAGGSDTGWLIATGKYIVQNHALPSHDIFTWTNSQAPFICYQWLFEVCQYYLFSAGGLTLVGFAAFCTALVLYLSVLPLWWQRLGLSPMWSYVFLAPALTPFWVFARPQLVSYLLAAATIFILETWRFKPQSKAIYCLPLLAVLWTNSHCFAALLPLLAFCYFFCQVEAGAAARRRLLTVAAASTLALFVTPFNPADVAVALNLFVHTDVNACNELKPLYLTSQILSWCNIYTAAALYLLIRYRRSVPLCGRIIGLASLFAGLAIARLAPLGVILSWPYLGLVMQALTEPGKSAPESCKLGPFKPMPLIGQTLCAVGLAFLIWSYKIPNEDAARQSFLGHTEALSYVSFFCPDDGRLFNDTIAGSRLIFLGKPRVYIDSRLFMFDKQFFDKWLSVLNAEPNTSTWHDFLASQPADKPITAVVLTHGTKLYQTLLTIPEWRLIIDDGSTSYWTLKPGRRASALCSMLNTDDFLDSGQFLAADGGDLTGDVLAHHVVARAAKHYENARTYLARKNLKAALYEAERSVKLLKSDKNQALLQQISAQMPAAPAAN